MRAEVMTVADPFDPLGSRVRRHLCRPRKVRGLAPRGPAPCIALLNGRPLMRAGWRYRLRDGDLLVFVILPRGGDRGGSNPLRVLLSIAIMVFAGWAAPALLGATAAATPLFGIGASAFTLGQATSLGIALAGSALVNALLPMPGAAPAQTPSPTYTLSAQGNGARIDQAIPVQYGRLLVYPDFAAQPYVEYAGGEQYLYQLLCLGAGEYEIENIRIEDTPLASFTEIDTEIVAPGGEVTLFPTAVVTSVEVSGQELTAREMSDAATWARTGTTITVTETDHGRASGQAIDLEFTTGGGPDGQYTIAGVIGTDSFTVQAASGSGSGAVTIRDIIGGLGGFVASPAGSVAHRLGIDLVLPAGLIARNDAGNTDSAQVDIRIEAQRIDDDGAALAAWFEMGRETWSDRTDTPLRKSFFYALATPGRYRVRVTRMNYKHPLEASGDQVLFAGLRAYLREAEDFGPVTLIAMRIRATNNVSQQASRRLSVLCTRKLPVWSAGEWTWPQPTRSIAWALADAARNADYGAGLPDARIDIEALEALDAIWAARGDFCDARLDQTGTWWEAATRLASAGRARVFMQGGVLRIVRDGPASIPVALYSMRNIRRGSLAIDYLMSSEDTADAVRVKYFDAATWSTRRVTATLPGSTADTPAEIDLSRVITDRNQATREAFYHAAANCYRRRIAKWSTEMEGFIPSIGDLVALQHDMPGWGAHAEAVTWDAGSRTLSVTEPMEFGAGAHYVGLRRPDGSVSGPWAVVAGATDRDLVLAEAPDFSPETGSARERTHVVFGPGDRWAALARITSVRPRGLYEVELEAVLEDPAVHTAEDGQSPPALRASQLPGAVTRPVAAGLLARLMPGDSNRAMLAWRPAPGAEVYQIEMAEGSDVTDPDVSWTRVAETTAAHRAVTMLYPDQALIRVRGVGLVAGPWVARSIGDLIDLMWTGADSDLMWTGADSDLMWG
jgi:hypothetical protein